MLLGLNGGAHISDIVNESIQTASNDVSQKCRTAAGQSIDIIDSYIRTQGGSYNTTNEALVTLKCAQTASVAEEFENAVVNSIEQKTKANTSVGLFNFNYQYDQNNIRN